MTPKKLYWGIAIMILGFVALQIYLHVDMKIFKEGLEATKIEPETPKTRDVVMSEGTPIDMPKNNANQQAEPAEVQIAEAPQENSQQNDDDVQSNTSHEDQPFSPLTSTELDELYQQMSTEISQLNSEEELDKGLDLTQYTPRQRAHLLTVGINLSLLPDFLADKIIAHQRRKKGLPPLPKKGEVVIHNLTRTPSGGITFGGTVEPLPGETADEASDRMIQEALKQANMLPTDKESKR